MKNREGDTPVDKALKAGSIYTIVNLLEARLAVITPVLLLLSLFYLLLFILFIFIANYGIGSIE